MRVSIKTIRNLIREAVDEAMCGMDEDVAATSELPSGAGVNTNPETDTVAADDDLETHGDVGPSSDTPMRGRPASHMPGPVSEAKFRTLIKYMVLEAMQEQLNPLPTGAAPRARPSLPALGIESEEGREFSRRTGTAGEDASGNVVFERFVRNAVRKALRNR